MSYEMEDIQKSQKIFYELITKSFLSEDDEPELYHAYAESSEVMNLVKSQGFYSDCDIEKYGNTIYLIPHLSNLQLGFTRKELKNNMCKSGCTNKDYYLTQFIIITIIAEFYDGQGSHCKSRDFLRLGELQNIVSERLKEGLELEQQKEEEGTLEIDESGLDYKSMCQAYEALKSSDKMTKSKTTKEGVMLAVLNFLDKQGLIAYISEDEMIKTMPKLDNIMEMKLLNEANYDRIMKALGVEKDEQDESNSNYES